MLESLAIVISISGVVSWGITQLLRALLVRLSVTDNKLFLRLAAMIVGGIMGYLLVSGAPALAFPAIMGIGLGLSAGILNTTIVAIVKSKMKSSMQIGNNKSKDE